MILVALYARGMRYAEGGGLTAEERMARERLRLEAAAMFAEDVASPEVARALRVHPVSVNRWRRAWEAGGVAALISKGPASVCRLDQAQLAVLEAALDQGPAVHGWVEDQRWTLERIGTVIYRLFKVCYTVPGVSKLMHRIGWSVQVPAHRAVARDEQVIAKWKDEQWPIIKGRSPSWGPGCASRTRPGSLGVRPSAAPGPGAGTPRC